MDVVTSADRPDLDDEVRAAFRERWPEFVFHGQAAPTYLPKVTEYFSYFDVLLLDHGSVAAGGWGVPLAWDGTPGDLPDGYDGSLARSVLDHESGRVPTTLSFMAAAVAPSYDRLGLATEVLGRSGGASDEARATARSRATSTDGKHRYPLQNMAEYAAWSRPDGLSIDPWIRTHQRMGARILAPAERSMVITGTVAEWESRTFGSSTGEPAAHGLCMAAEPGAADPGAWRGTGYVEVSTGGCPSWPTVRASQQVATCWAACSSRPT